MPRRTESDYDARVRIALRAAAFYRDLSNEALAASIGVAPNTVGRWIRGERRMSAEDAAALTAALNAPSDLFLRPPATRDGALAMMADWDRRHAEARDPALRRQLIARAFEVVESMGVQEDRTSMPSPPRPSIPNGNGEQ